jgi:hypothetical protein
MIFYSLKTFTCRIMPLQSQFNAHHEDPSITLQCSCLICHGAAVFVKKHQSTRSTKSAKTQAPAGGPNPSPGPPTLGTPLPTKLCASGMTCTGTLTCVSKEYSECNPSGCCVNPENPPGPPVSFLPVTLPPASDLSLFTHLGAGKSSFALFVASDSDED